MGGTIWKGSINFGDTDVPVKLHAAVKEERIQFHLLHRLISAKFGEIWSGPTCAGNHE